MSLRLRPATEEDMGDMVDVSTAAFDPSTDAIVRRIFASYLQGPRGIHDEELRQRRIVRKAGRLHDKRIVMAVAVDDVLDGKVVGYVICELPVQDGDEVEDEAQPPQQGGFPGADQAARDEMNRIVEEDAHQTFGERGTKDVWLIVSLGVDPQHQRRSIGKMLMNWVTQKANEDGRDCYLVATPAGHPLYRSAGFEDVRTLDIFGTPHVSMRKRHEGN